MSIRNELIIFFVFVSSCFQLLLFLHQSFKFWFHSRDSKNVLCLKSFCFRSFSLFLQIGQLYQFISPTSENNTNFDPSTDLFFFWFQELSRPDGLFIYSETWPASGKFVITWSNNDYLLLYVLSYELTWISQRWILVFPFVFMYLTQNLGFLHRYFLLLMLPSLNALVFRRLTLKYPAQCPFPALRVNSLIW